jgi:hypothetical protein
MRGVTGLNWPDSSGRNDPRSECRRIRFPTIYRFVCPDGRSYVGAVGDSRKRGGIQRSNARLLAAFELHPPETPTAETRKEKYTVSTVPLSTDQLTQALTDARRHG